MDGEPTIVEVPGSGIASVMATEAHDHPVVVTEHTMNNGLISVTWNLDGEVISIIDVGHGRQLLPAGRITLELAPDHPVEYDAWDVESWTRSLGSTITSAPSIQFATRHPLLAELVVRREFGNSSVIQTYTVRAGSARLDIHFDIDWHEDEKLLSMMVPIDVRTQEASCDIQFGHVMRPTHASSSWDAAKFEVCASIRRLQRAVVRVAVLNDGRYGHGVQDGGVRVSLLRAAKYPDPDADHGRHAVTISVLPHGPGLHDVLHEADALNLPLRPVTSGDASDAPAPVVTIDNRGVQISSVKHADDGSGQVIVRLYEACGDRATVTIRTARPIRGAVRCNLAEEATDGIECSDGIVSLTLRPFELVTVRLLH